MKNREMLDSEKLVRLKYVAGMADDVKRILHDFELSLGHAEVANTENELRKAWRALNSLVELVNGQYHDQCVLMSDKE